MLEKVIVLLLKKNNGKENLDMIERLSRFEVNITKEIGDFKNDLGKEIINDFILNSFALLNVFLTAPFNLDVMENCVENTMLRAGVIAPSERINKLEKHRASLNDVSVYVETIISFFKDEYNVLSKRNTKADAIEDIIRKNIRKRIAIIVPKAYYKDVLKTSSVFGINTSNVFIETLKGFNPEHYYDVIIVVGDFDKSRFKLFECCSTSKIYVLLYEYENQLHLLKKRKATVYADNIYRKHNKYTYTVDEKIEQESIK